MGFGLVNNPFGDHLIGVFLEPGFFARELLEMAFGRLGPTLLQALPKGMMPLALAFDRLGTPGFPLGVGSHIDDPKINTEGSSRFIGWRGGNIKSYSQREGPFAVDKVCLPLDGMQTSLLICSDLEGYQHAPMDSQQRDRHQALEGHDTLIIDDSAFWLKCGLNALVTLVGFTGLADTADGQLSGQLISGTQFSIHQLFQFKLVSRFRSPSDRSHIIGGCIELVHGLKQGAVLIFSWNKLQEHRLFHRTSVSRIEKIVSRQEYHSIQIPNKESHSSRPLKGGGPPARFGESFRNSCEEEVEMNQMLCMDMDTMSERQDRLLATLEKSLLTKGTMFPL